MMDNIDVGIWADLSEHFLLADEISTVFLFCGLYLDNNHQ